MGIVNAYGVSPSSGYIGSIIMASMVEEILAPGTYFLMCDKLTNM